MKTILFKKKRIELGEGHIIQYTIFENKNIGGIWIYNWKTILQNRFHTHAFNSSAFLLSGGYTEEVIEDGKIKTREVNQWLKRRREMPNVEPNRAHKALVDLEEDYDVIHVTQNVSDLLERAGASKVYHLHGELTKARGETGNKISDRFKPTKMIDIGYNDIKLGDLCEENGKQLRPNVVWFGEYPQHVDRGYKAIENADILLIVGTSLQIGYTLDMLQSIKDGGRVIYIDPEPMNYLSNYGMKVEYIRERAEKGVTTLVELLLDEAQK